MLRVAKRVRSKKSRNIDLVAHHHRQVRKKSELFTAELFEIEGAEMELAVLHPDLAKGIRPVLAYDKILR